MTPQQKQLLRAVPVALGLVGLIAFRYRNTGADINQQGRLGNWIPPAGPVPSPGIDDQARTSRDLLLLPDFERRLAKDEEFVLMVEAFYAAIRGKPDPGLERREVEQVAMALTSLRQKKAQLYDMRADKMPDDGRDRVLIARSKCSAFIERLTRARGPTE